MHLQAYIYMELGGKVHTRSPDKPTYLRPFFPILGGKQSGVCRAWRQIEKVLWGIN